MTTTLYDYWRSSAAYRLRIVLNMMGLDYEQVPVDLATGVHKSPENIARNPQGLVPSLDIDGQMLTQSLAIIEYLDEVHGADLLPKDALGRVRVRTISFAIAMEIHPVCNLSVARFAADNSGGEITMQDWMLQFIPKGLAGVETLLTKANLGMYCHGDKVTMADICLVPQLYNAARWGVDMGPFPVINGIMARLEKLDFVAAAHPDQNMVTAN